MAVHTAIRTEAVEVQAAIVCLTVLYRAQEGGILEKIALPDGLGDAGELLINDAACADVQVPDLAVAHLPIRQAHILA